MAGDTRSRLAAETLGRGLISYFDIDILNVLDVDLNAVWPKCMMAVHQDTTVFTIMISSKYRISVDVQFGI